MLPSRVIPSSLGDPILMKLHNNQVCVFKSWIREHFVCVDQDKLLYHFLVEGTTVKDGSKVQCDVS